MQFFFECERARAFQYKKACANFILSNGLYICILLVFASHLSLNHIHLKERRRIKRLVFVFYFFQNKRLFLVRSSLSYCILSCCNIIIFFMKR